MKKIAIIGCGGINSWFIQHLKEITKLFDKDKLIYIKLFDNDVVEEKNLLRSNQNFKVEDIMQEKAKVLGDRYSVDYENVLITKENLTLLETFDDIILGVDNNKTRQLIYEYALNNRKYLLDLRAQGTQIAFYVLDLNKTMENYNKEMFNNKEVLERKGSCQLTEDVQNDHIENGNKIIAFMGAYGIYLKRLRDEKTTTNDWRFVY